MQLIDGQIVYSATNLVGFLECWHLANLECLGPAGGEDEAYSYVRMLQRQAEVVLRVVEGQLAAAVPRLERGELQANSLIGLLAAEQSRAEEGSVEFWYSPDYASVTWRGRQFVFTGPQAAVVGNLHRAHEQRLGALNSALALEGSGREGARMSDVFKRHPAWGTLIVKVGRSAYRLDLSPKVAESSPSVA